MCGISGIVSLTDAPVPADDARSMAAALAHRGPDDAGHWTDGACALGFRRLAVIDLSPAAAQPMELGALRIVFNGEIYNFRELRAELEKKGRTFRTKSDTEVILHLYELHGDRCVERLRGMFAFAIWDSKNRRLFAARDRAGKKPFVYAVAGGCFLFASELQALAALKRFPRTLDPQALDLYLHYQYVPAPWTIWKDARKLPPGHTLVVEGGQVRVSKYWDLDFRLKDLYRDSAEAEERFRALFDDAVRARLVSDVPLGAFLSGGIDSSAVVEAMSRLSGKVRTFSIGFDDAHYSELPHARAVAERFATEHHEEVVRPNAIELLPKLVRAYGEPFADSSAVPTFHVSRLARRHVTVALSGDGGDESFLGYPRVAAIETAAALTKLPRPVRGALAAAARLLPTGGSPRSLPRRIRRFLSLEGGSAEQHFTELIAYFGAARRRSLYTPEFAAQVPGDAAEFMHRLFTEAPADRLTEKALYSEARSYLPDDLLAKVDIASMMNSLEVRCPLLDHPIMEFAARLPLRFKKDRVNTKVFMKRALAGRLPADLLNRPKQGFGVPLEAWFRGELKDYSRDLLLARDARVKGMLRDSEVARYLDEHAAGADHSNRLWALVALETWARDAGV